MASRRKREPAKGSRQHAEGGHGPRTHARLIEQINSGTRIEAEPQVPAHDRPGKHRLFESREQHDEADRNRDKNRLDRDVREHGHDRDAFQVRGRK